MKAEIIAVGTELLAFGRRDSNGDWIAARLSDRGLDVSRRTIVGDDEESIAHAIGSAHARVELVVVTGGLGPTADDLTREGLARALGTRLLTDETLRRTIAARLAAAGYRSEEPAERQARIPEGCDTLPNSVGSAPGLLHRGEGHLTIVLPGVPAEMKAMLAPALDRIGDRLPSESVARADFLVTGLPESEVDARLTGYIGRLPSSIVTILAGEGGVELHLASAAGSGEEGAQEVAAVAAEIRSRLGPAIAAEGSATLADVVGAALLGRGETLAAAESCTGGLLGAVITSVPGSSAWFRGGFVVYADDLKRDLLGIPCALLEEHGTVSEPVACAMAEGARSRTGATYALALTGIAGPGGGGADKPVGLVHFALAAPGETTARHRMFGGDRAAVRARSVTASLELLRRRLLGAGR